MNIILEHGDLAGKTTSLAVDENHDLIVITSSQGSIHLLTVQKLPWSKDLPDPPEPRGFLPVDENSWVDILAVYKDDLEERKQNVQVPCLHMSTIDIVLNVVRNLLS